MARKENAICCVCRRGAAKWLCRCANEVICKEGACLGTHTARSSKSHVLVEYELGIQVQQQEAESHKKSVDTALEAIEFVREEGEWLLRERDRLAVEIDRKVEEYVNEIRYYATRKKQLLSQIIEVSIDALKVFKTTEKREYVMKTKQQQRHLVQLRCVLHELNTIKLIEPKGSESRYILAGNPKNEPDDPIRRMGQPFDPFYERVFEGFFETISFQTSKHIELTGVSLSKGARPGALLLDSLEVLFGDSITCPVLYSHSEQLDLASDDEYKADVHLHKSVSIDPHRRYTIKVMMRGRSKVVAGALQSNEQQGLVVTPLHTVVKDFRKERSSGVFFELHYFG